MKLWRAFCHSLYTCCESVYPLLVKVGDIMLKIETLHHSSLMSWDRLAKESQGETDKKVSSSQFSTLGPCVHGSLLQHRVDVIYIQIIYIDIYL